MVYFIAHKIDVLQKFREFVAMDDEGVYIADVVGEFCKAKGIQIVFTVLKRNFVMKQSSLQIISKIGSQPMLLVSSLPKRRRLNYGKKTRFITFESIWFVLLQPHPACESFQT